MLPLNPDHEPQAALIEALGPAERLALAYASVRARPLWLGMLALDARLAGVIRNATQGGREPMLAQIKLAWWRERLAEPHDAMPKGEALLAALGAWGGAHGRLIALVDGWEALLGAAPLSGEALAVWVTGRAQACAGLAEVLGVAVGVSARMDAVERMARGWALGDLVPHLGDPQERTAAEGLARAQDWTGARMPRAMRPLSVLYGLARRTARDGRPAAGTGALLTAMRLGISGF